MGIDKVSVTLYDVFGYLLPGYLALLVLSLIESSFWGTRLLALSHFTRAPLPSGLAAYFLGHVCHSVASKLRKMALSGRNNQRGHIGTGSWLVKFRQDFGQMVCSLFDDPTMRLSDVIENQIDREVKSTYGINLSETNKRLESYLLSDSYVTIAGNIAERDIMASREGFYKASMVVLAILALVLFCAAVHGGLIVQTQPGIYTFFTRMVTCVSGFCCLFVANSFREGFIFFNRVKNNTVKLSFLAIKAKERMDK